jgi:sporulation protein YlmC with PRC-barrel domain
MGQPSAVVLQRRIAMFRSVKELKGYSILATDGEIGRVSDFYFDALAWTIRYLVVDTGAWLAERRVLLSPTVLHQPDWETHKFPVALSQEQIKNSPDIMTDKPVSRQQETELYNYYNWSPYWESGVLLPLGAGGLAPIAPTPTTPPPGLNEEQLAEEAGLAEASGDPHLHSANTVIGYYIQARDNDIGHIDDFIIDDETWAIQYMIVETSNWLPGKKVQITPNWVKTISWTEKAVHVDLQRETIENSPEYEVELLD